MPIRSRPLVLGGLTLAVVLAPLVGDRQPVPSLVGTASAAPVAPLLPCLALAPIATGLPSAPVAITHAGDGSGRLFITLLDGRVLIYEANSLRVAPFLDIRSLVLSGGEQGLLSVAFHPSYETNGFFFVYYTRASAMSADRGDIVVARYSVSLNDPNLADPGSARAMLVIDHQTYGNHNGGQMHFGPDGYLYLSVGDGGSGGDPFEAAQNLASPLGKMLRVDVDQNVDTPPFYGIPPSNPFAGSSNSTTQLIWAYGLRNPWRFSFDRATGALIISDAGQAEREEINLQMPFSPGGENYGWDVLEGTRCFEDAPAGSCTAFLQGGSVLPAIEYTHSAGDCVVIGGYRYWGPRHPEYHGGYVYADHCTGRIWGARRLASGAIATALLHDSSFLNPTTFGEDEAGEIYVGHLQGAVYRLDLCP